MSSLAQIPLESYLLAQQAAPIECLVCKQENCRSATRCRACRAPMALAHQAEIGEARAAADRRARRERRGQDDLPRHADGHPDAASGAAPHDGPWPALDLLAADDGHRPVDRLVPRKNGPRPRTLALGALSIPLSTTPTADRSGVCRRGGRRLRRRDRTRRPLPGDPRDPGAIAPA